MDSPRLSALLVAYLRGLLPYNYPFATASRIRETLVVSALMQELDGEHRRDMGMVVGSAIARAADKQVPAVLEQAMGLLLVSHAMRTQRSPARIAELSKQGDWTHNMDRQVAALKILQGSNIKDIFRKVLLQEN